MIVVGCCHFRYLAVKVLTRKHGVRYGNRELEKTAVTKPHIATKLLDNSGMDRDDIID